VANVGGLDGVWGWVEGFGTIRPRLVYRRHLSIFFMGPWL